ncbi:MAG: sulfite exporter TauE/SafE family protein [Planctomycetota bacterium]
MTALLVSVLVASLLGSLHCAGMCGGFVAYYSGQGAGCKLGNCHQRHLAYSLGRLVSYSVLGALAGTLGASLERAGAFVGVQRVAAVGSGVLIVLWGLLAVFPGLWRPRLGRWLPAQLRGAVARGAASLNNVSPTGRAAALGLLSTLLPCGWLYAFAVCAAGTASSWKGVVVMATFWAGTLPILLGLGYGLQLLSLRLRQRIPVLSGAALLVIGLLTLLGRVDALGTGPQFATSSAPKTQEQWIEDVNRWDAHEAPCCSGH